VKATRIKTIAKLAEGERLEYGPSHAAAAEVRNELAREKREEEEFTHTQPKASSTEGPPTP
jgi:hypothetical protein